MAEGEDVQAETHNASPAAEDKSITAEESHEHKEQHSEKTAQENAPPQVEITTEADAATTTTANADAGENSFTSVDLTPSSSNNNMPSLPPRSPLPMKSPGLDESQTKVLQGLSGDFPYPISPPPSSTERKSALEARNIGERTTSPPAQALRKASSGFGALFGRMGRRTAQSPPAGSKESKSTAASVASVDHHTTSSMSSNEGTRGRPSLQDQFSSLRRQEEFGMGAAGDQESVSGTGDENAVPSQPTSPDRAHGETRQNRAQSGASLPKTPLLNNALPPGTASGMTVGPSVVEEEVDWDLWQQVVYEGPAAVTRSSGAELNHAIASGIPPAIRGVVWQVFAESKNEGLEDIYRTLKARGTDLERPMNGSRTLSNFSNAEKDTAAASDAASEHSDTSAVMSPGLHAEPNGFDSARILAEKQKREAAALQKLEKAIKRDLGSRTSYSKYTQSAGLQDGLFGVCKAYALFDEGVGYAQGINFIAMPLLFNMSEEEAFTLLVRLMSKYDLRSMFTPEMAGLHLRLYQFERLLEDFDPAVYCHLKRRHVEPQLYATQWFLTLFAYRFPLQLVLRIYDLILCEGLSAILKFGIALMQKNRAALLEMKDMSQLTNFLKEKIFDVYIDKSPTPSSLLDSGFFGSVSGGADKELYRAEEMIRDACAISIPEATLARYTSEWEETSKAEREREAELEHLRTSNVSLASKVKALEERVQQHDTEHVAFANDLVKVKMENDTLHDENEGLKLQVAELQRMLETQPAEVEAKLKQEMDRIMQRNIEVQNENRSVKEEMAEMEHELVKTKMLTAQTQADHDTLKQKWSSIQALMNDGK